MAAMSAVAWTFIGAALMLAAKSQDWWRGMMVPSVGIVTGSFAALLLLGHLYTAVAVNTIPTLSTVALQTATFILAVSIGLILSVPDRGLMRLIREDGPAGMLVRRALPVLIAAPILLGLIRLMGERYGLYDAPVGSALRTMVEITLFLVLLWRTGVAISRQEQKRQEADEAMQASQRRVLDTLESITDGFVAVDRSWRYLYVNSEAEQMMGRSFAELLGKNVWDVFPEAVGGRAYRELHRAAADRLNVEFEDYNPVLQRWFANKAYPTPDGIVVYFEDITQRKQAETELLRSQQEMEVELGDTRLLQRISGALISNENAVTLFESILDASMSVMRSDFSSLQMLYPDQGLGGGLRMLAFRGFSAETAKCWEWIHADASTVCAKALRERERVVVADIERSAFIADTGDLAMYRQAGIRAVQSTPLISREGKMLGMISTHWRAPHDPSERDLRLFDILARQAADLIERRKAEEALREREAALNEAQRVAHVGSWQWDAATDEYTVSDELRRIFGIPAGQAIPALKDQDGLMYPHDSWLLVHAALQDALLSGEEYTLDVEALRNGERIFIATRGEIVRDGAARPVGLRGTVQDITERKAIETAREQSLEREHAARVEAERALRLKDEFLATVSHELRTPLSAILGWSYFLKKDISDPAKARYAAEVIERNGQLQAQLISDLLDMSRILAGKMRLNVTRVDLPLVINAAIESVLPAADAKGVWIQQTVSPELSDAINGDPDRLQQVVWNLLSNAVKFTPRGGHVSVVAALVESHVEIRVSDTGKGISREFLPHIFDRFRQAETPATRSHGGLGIGLALVKELVELHGGHVHATSGGKDQGAVFVIELPVTAVLEQRERVASESHTAPEEPSLSPTHLSQVKILVVDDEPDVLDMLRRALEESEAVVRTAVSCDDALSALESDNFDVIVSDIGMPVRDGYAFIKEARSRGFHTPAMALTAFARPEDHQKSILSGYQAHVSKPVRIGQLLAAVSALAANGSRSSN
jgi:PAS domain S-box-containing protein